MNQCRSIECTVISNESTETIPKIYLDAFEKKNIGVPYMYRPYSYPEIMVYKGLPEEALDKMCELGKQSLSTTECFK